MTGNDVFKGVFLGATGAHVVLNTVDGHCTDYAVSDVKCWSLCLRTFHVKCSNWIKAILFFPSVLPSWSFSCFFF